tara:strand:- start:401 stop:928 length:528 start_codon:yes stop_codon:yes gene_type:complete
MKLTPIIFDGPDMCGKTEMAKALSHRLGIPYFKNKNEWSAFENDPSYFQNALQYGDTFFYSYLKQTDANVILDRSYPSEWVYSLAFGRPRDLEMLRHIDNMAAEAEVKIVIPYRTNYDNITDDVHDINSDDLKLVHAMYCDFAEWTKCDVLRLCVDSEDLFWEINSIISFLEEKS